MITRRGFTWSLGAILAGGLGASSAAAKTQTTNQRRSIDRGLKYLANVQARSGRWEADGGMYPVAMTSLAGMALLLDGNTAMQGRYAENVQAAIGYLLDQVQPNGLIGHPQLDGRYMYGHGFSMLFLSQILGEEEDVSRRRRLIEVLSRAVEFSGKAQTVDGGWGYVSARDGHGFDEGSVTITQMQSLRACRNAGIGVPKEIVDKGIKYIERCTDPATGGVRYSLKTSGSARPPITAAAVACLYSGGEYDNPIVAKLIDYADKTLGPTSGRSQSYGHWHYAHYYYSQVVYRQGDDKWDRYRKGIFDVIIKKQKANGSWSEGYIGPVYTTSLNLTILQLDNGYLPIYQR
ncbi:hypothetical protein Pan216_56620 [Planctomycetes bacterium Pan216]|uniref:Prenyltransferase and squalene oxidase repeat protein n=1 Tax=Kolteria novifilia TaxID=2527975 RepID=A0A518BCQ5_9BACT|nr:hypothetical protein Pan216_56620 [Planctomycetes bacterium Pan216]